MGLDGSGDVVGLHVRISGQSILASLLPQNLKDGMDQVVFPGLNPGGAEAQFGYDIPNLLIDHAMRNPHLTAGFWRGVDANQNAIYIECFMDELAHAAGQDPLEFRRKMLKPKDGAPCSTPRPKKPAGARQDGRPLAQAWPGDPWTRAAMPPAWPKFRSARKGG